MDQVHNYYWQVKDMNNIYANRYGFKAGKKLTRRDINQ